MSAGEWAGLLVGVAAVMAGVGAIPAGRGRTPLIVGCAILLVAAVTLALVGRDNGQESSQQDVVAQEPPQGAASPSGSGEREPEPSIAPTPDPEPSRRSEPVRHAGVVTLATRGDTIYLNAPSTSPQWQMSGGSDTAELWPTGEVALSGVEQLSLGEEVASYAVCSTSSGYAPGDHHLGIVLRDPASLRGHDCFRLSSGRFARIVMQEAGADWVRLDITTWEPS